MAEANVLLNSILVMSSAQTTDPVGLPSHSKTLREPHILDTLNDALMSRHKQNWRAWLPAIFPVLFLTPLLTASPLTNEVLTRIVVLRIGGIRVSGPWTNTSTEQALVRLDRPARIEISYAPIDSASNQPIRLLQRMEGLESEWQEAGGQLQRPEMQLMMMLQDQSFKTLFYHSITIRGESPGWTGEPETSPFVFQTKSFVLPPDAERLQVMLTAENWPVLGSVAITGFRVLRIGPDGQQEDIWPDPEITEGQNLDSAEGQPRYWQRGPVGARMAQVIKLAPPGAGHALVIRDDDLLMSATWQADLSLRDRARPGDTLRFEWGQAFSVGIGERSRATFEPMAPGNYVFRVKTVTPFGKPIGRELALRIAILQPLWKRPSFIASLVVGSAVIVSFTVWLILDRRMKVRLSRLEQRRRMEHERLRIARDIHDDLGASLTHMNLLTQTVSGKLEEGDPVRQDTEKLRTMAVGLTQKLDEIVWAVNPQHDTMESLMSYLTDFAEEFLAAAGVHARIRIPAKLPDWMLPSSLRHNVFLSAKEALNNAVRHGRPTEVYLELTVCENYFELTIEDNGGGFQPGSTERTSARHGLEGMAQRMESLDGRFEIHSNPGRGTRVTLRVPVKGTLPCS